MDAFTVAAELLGDLRLTSQLTSGQLAQLRAINRKYFQEVYTLLHPAGEDAQHTDARVEPTTASAELSLTAQQTADLHAMLERDILGLLTPEQRVILERDRLR